MRCIDCSIYDIPCKSLYCEDFSTNLNFFQLRRQETLFEGTRRIINGLIKLSIEAGFLTGGPSYGFWLMPRTKISYIQGSAAAVFLILLYLPGHPAYFQAVLATLAKTYSNSILAVLNSRARVVANFPYLTPPPWNEMGGPAYPRNLIGRQSLMFHEEGETSSRLTSEI